LDIETAARKSHWHLTGVSSTTGVMGADGRGADRAEKISDEKDGLLIGRFGPATYTKGDNP